MGEFSLEDILQVKQKHYVGTEQAIKYLRGLQYIETAPQDITQRINTQLKNPTYQATPERMAAALEILNAAKKIWRHYTIQYEQGNESWKEISAKECSLNNIYARSVDIFKPPSAEKTKLNYTLSFDNLDFKKIVADALIGAFKNANECKIKTDDEFIKFLKTTHVQSILEGQTDEKKEYIAKELESHCIDFEEQYRAAKLDAQNAVEQFCLDTAKIASRIDADQVSGRFEYRKQVIDQFLEAFFRRENALKKEYANKETSEIYSDIIKYSEQLIKNDDERRKFVPMLLEALKKIKKEDNDRESEENNDADGFNDEEVRDMLTADDESKKVRFYRKLIRTENRYTRSRIRAYKVKKNSRE